MECCWVSLESEGWIQLHLFRIQLKFQPPIRLVSAKWSSILSRCRVEVHPIFQVSSSSHEEVVRINLKNSKILLKNELHQHYLEYNLLWPLQLFNSLLLMALIVHSLDTVLNNYRTTLKSSLANLISRGTLLINAYIQLYVDISFGIWISVLLRLSHRAPRLVTWPTTNINTKRYLNWLRVSRTAASNIHHLRVNLDASKQFDKFHILHHIHSFQIIKWSKSWDNV